jgi:hypothetical protein
MAFRDRMMMLEEKSARNAAQLSNVLKAQIAHYVAGWGFAKKLRFSAGAGERDGENHGGFCMKPRSGFMT